LQPMPLRPMEPVLREEPFQQSDYIYQVKWDGVRMITDLTREDIQLWNRRGRNKTFIYPDILSELRSLEVSDVVFDGEIISFDERGKPNFRHVLKRDLAKTPRLHIPVCYVIFDCLRYQGQWMLDDPLERRQEVLQRLIEDQGMLQLCTSFDEGVALFDRMEALGMEGVVAKQRGSAYYPGRKLPIWQKIKCWQYLRVVARAVNYREGLPASVVVSELGEPAVNIASVSSGMSQADWRNVLNYVAPSSNERKNSTSDCVPLSTGVQIDVRFMEWTDDGHLRSPIVERVHFST
jgi:bifunctional non-homologous end joining protein LigD